MDLVTALLVLACLIMNLADAESVRLNGAEVECRWLRALRRDALVPLRLQLFPRNVLRVAVAEAAAAPSIT